MNMHRPQDTYPLSHFRQRTREHLDRIRDGRVETITQNGQAAMVVMSPERYDFLVRFTERGHVWREAIRAYKAGERGVPAADAIRSLAAEFGVEVVSRYEVTELARYEAMFREERMAGRQITYFT